MHARPHASLTAGRRAAAVVLAAAALAGCGSTAAEPPAAQAPSRALDAAGIAALADDRPPTALPPADPAGAAARAADLLLATLPAPAPDGPARTQQVAGALRSAARLVAATRADPAHLCGPAADGPAAAHATPALRRWLADPANAPAREGIETTIGQAAGADGCGPLAFVGPAVVPGPQAWAAEPDGGGAVLVAWSGSFGYALAGPGGVPEPWGQRATARFRFVRDAAGEWRLGSWDRATRRVAQGWPEDVPLPEGYLPVPAPVAGDRAALDAVRGAAAAWQAAPASELAVDQAQTGPGGTAAPGSGATGAVPALTARVVAAPSRGDAHARFADGSRTLWTDGGRRVLRTGPPGQAPAGGPAWTERDGAAPVEWGVSAPVDPWATAALLAAAGAAAPARCPDGLAAAKCWTAAVRTGTGPPALARVPDAGLARRAGVPWLVLDVGTDRQGRPAHVRVAQTAPSLGGPHAALTSTTRFAAYPKAAPPPAPLPGPAAIAPAREDGQ